MTETSPNQLNQYFSAGVSLIKLHHWSRTGKNGIELGKAPVHPNWPTRDYSKESITSWIAKDNNVGVRLGETWAVIDIDPRNGGVEGQKILEEKYNLNFEKHARVLTGRGDGGIHIYVRIPRGWRGMAKHPDIPGVDFKHHTGMQVVAAGSKHPVGGVYKWAPKSIPLQATGACPQQLLEAYTVNRPPKELAGKGSESFGGIDPEEIGRALEYLDPCEFNDHDDWLTLMMSVHWLTGGEAREEFVEWSTSDPEYKDQGEVIAARWDSLSRDGGFSTRVVTGAYLYKVMNQSGVGEHAPKVSLSHDFDELEDSDLEADQAETMTAELRVLKDMNKKHAMVNLAGRAFVTQRVSEADENGKELERIQFSQSRDMREMYASKQLACQVQGPSGVKTVMNNYFDFWRTHPNRREYQNVVFDPTKEHEFETGNGVKTLNLWEGLPFNAKSRGKGDWSCLRRVVKEAIANNHEELYEYILNWVAFSLQVRGRPQRTALVMRGPRGTGKGTLAREWLNLWGLHGIATDDGDDLFGKYNADMEYKCGVFLDEAFWAGDKATLGKLKSRITEPKFRVEQKHQPKRNARNFLKIMMASNEDYVIPAAPNDRRFQMVDVAPVFKDNGAFFQKLHDEMDNGGRQAFFYDMMTRDVSNFDPERNRINTDALRSQVRLSYGETAEWWLGLLENGELPHQVGPWAQSPVFVPVSSLRDHFVDFLGGSRRGDWAYNFDQKFYAALKRLMPEEIDVPRKRIQVYFDDDHVLSSATNKQNRIRCYQFPSLEECREWAKKLFGEHLFNDSDIVYMGGDDEILEQVKLLTEEMIEAALEGEYNLCDEINQTIDRLMEKVSGGDLI